MLEPLPEEAWSRRRGARWWVIATALLASWCASPHVRTWWGYDRVIAASEAFSRSRSDADLRTLVGMIRSGGLRGANAAAALMYIPEQMSRTQVHSIVIPALVEGLGHSNGSVRLACVNTLNTAFANDAQPAEAQLRLLLNDTADLRTPMWADELLEKLRRGKARP